MNIQIRNTNTSLALATGVASCLMCVAFIAGEATAQTRIDPAAVSVEVEQHVPAAPDDVDDVLEGQPEAEEAEGVAAKLGKGHEFVIVPMPGHDPQQGWQLTVPAFLLYKPPVAQSDERVWISGVIGMYSENKSWAAGLFHRMSLADDKWRVMASLGHANVNYDYYGTGETNESQSIPLNQEIDLVMAKALRRIAPSLYAGLKVVYSKTDIGLDIPLDNLPPIIDPSDLRVGLEVLNLVPRLEYDTRDNEFYPTDGYLVEAQVAISRDSLGSDVDFEKYSFDINRYFAFGTKSVIAARLRTDYASSGTPFFLVPAFGSGTDLRGYKSGTYRDNFLFAMQAEYRYKFTDKIAATAFAGVGTVAEDFADWDKSLPSLGIGLRYQVAKRNKMNVRADFAWGRGDSQFYLGVGEAF